MLERVFWIIKETSNIEGFEIFQKKFIFTAYVDDTTFFLRNTESVINLLEIFKHFSQCSGLKPNKLKCEIASIGALKGVKVPLCGIRLYTYRKIPLKHLEFIIHTVNDLKMTRISKSTLQKLRMC